MAWAVIAIGSERRVVRMTLLDTRFGTRFGIIIVRIPDDAFPPLTKYVSTFIHLQTLCEHQFSFPSSVIKVVHMAQETL